MKIDNEIKYDFCDVLIRPKRSKAPSRHAVNLNRTFKMLNSQKEWSGIPIIASNMDVVGTFSMAEKLSLEDLSTCLHKHYDLETLLNFFNKETSPIKNVFYTLGIKDSDFGKLYEFSNKKNFSDENLNITIDVANGYTEFFVNKCREVREKFPKSMIMAGNVCTPEMVQELILTGGVDVVKVGIGPGCFVAGTLITTKSGKKPIEDVKVGDYVLTHYGNFRKVKGRLARKTNKVMCVNNVKCTENHEFYVVHRSDYSYKLIHDYTKWVEAKNLTKDYHLISLEPNGSSSSYKYEVKLLEKLETYDTDEVVYDLEVEEEHSYVANDIIVHNSVCTTRLATGVGYPQLSAIMDCADAAHGLNGHICADGGCTTPGDVAKAFGAGADFVMLGGMLAGCDECDGEWQIDTDSVTGAVSNKRLKFYGMSSQEAMDKYSGGVADYKTSEGKSVDVPYKGPALSVVKNILGGLRSSCTYVGTEKLKDFSKCCTFIRVNRTHNRIFE